MDSGGYSISDDSQTIVSARDTKCAPGAVEHLGVATMGFLSTVSGRISSLLDEAGCMCMDDDDVQSRRRSRRRPAAAVRDNEDPPLFPGGSAHVDTVCPAGSSSTQSAQPTLLREERCERRNTLIDELAGLHEVQDGAVREEVMMRIVKQLIRMQVESDRLGKDVREALEASIMAKLGRARQSVPNRMNFFDSIVVTLDELFPFESLWTSWKQDQEVLLEQLIAVMNLEVQERMMASACKKNEPSSKPAPAVRQIEKTPAANSAPFRWVRHELQAIPERGESTATYEAFTELAPNKPFVS